MYQRTLEDFHAFGKLYQGETLLGHVEYYVRVYRTVDSAKRLPIDREPQGLKEIRGRLIGFLDKGRDLCDLVGREDITLDLGDGRLWDCTVVDSDGALVNRSGVGLYVPKQK